MKVFKSKLDGRQAHHHKFETVFRRCVCLSPHFGWLVQRFMVHVAVFGINTCPLLVIVCRRDF